MSTTSTVVAVKAQLKTKLTTQLGTDAVLGESGATPTVYYSHPGAELGVDGVYLGDVKEGVSEVASARAGRKKRTEFYLLEVVFEIVRPGPDALTATTQAYKAFASLENLLADDPSIGLGTGAPGPTLTCVLHGWRSNDTVDAGTGGWRCRLTADVGVTVRLG